METSKFNWIFNKKCEVPADVQKFLVVGEEAKVAYKTVRDIAIFTNKRLIIRDAQGLTGSKVEMYSIPYNSINMWSTENGKGVLNFTSEVELWTRAGHMKINLAKGIDMIEFEKMLSNFIL